ncbi:Ribosomal protein [Trema orientale]|uniref:Ribosomal protein n=1 Tax=Trema orientale TaxID=63057 RepID=A0A2P5FPG6_TREOI|nr:Ribosomal protein [Trema orientale]
MQNLQRVIIRLSSISLNSRTSTLSVLNEKTKDVFQNSAVIHLKNGSEAHQYVASRVYSATSRGDGENDGEGEWGKLKAGTFGGSPSDDLGWDSTSSWSTGLTKEHFDGEVAGHHSSGSDTSHSAVISEIQDVDDKLKEMEAENRRSKAFVDGWGNRMRETSVLLKQVREPGARGSYLKDSEKAEMYRLHKQNPEVYTVEKLAKDYRIMRQRVHAILWLKELEEEEEKKLGHPLDDSVELLLDTCPEFFNSHDREFHVASLPYKPDFKVMPEGWDGTTRDLDEVHYEISQKEDEMLYQEFVQRMNFNKKKMAGEVFRHKYSRRRPSNGWNFTVEKLGPRGKRGGGGGWKFVSIADGSSRPLDEMEKMYVKRETPRRRRKILP